jgi:hypothetical protein
VAEGSQRRERDAVEAQRQRADWFGKSLGDDWVEVEPGIYEQRPAASRTRLEQDLLHAPPTLDGEPRLC